MLFVQFPLAAIILHTSSMKEEGRKDRMQCHVAAAIYHHASFSMLILMQASALTCLHALRTITPATTFVCFFWHVRCCVYAT